MPIGELFRKNYKYIELTSKNEVENQEVEQSTTPFIPDDLLTKCPACGEKIYKEALPENFHCCTVCNHHFRINATERLKIIIDEGSFEEINKTMVSVNTLNYPDYEKKIASYQEKSGNYDGVVTGSCLIKGRKTVIGVMDSTFMMGSMGSVVGEKITRAIEKADAEKLPLVIFTASGGARMQEGIMSLMQMAKTSSALKRFSDNGGLFISVITDPTTGGVTASFAMLGDIIIGEKGALIGFAGKRVIEQTIKQKLPNKFQTVEFLLEHGFIDKIAARSELKDLLGNILSLHQEVDQDDDN